MDVAGLWESVEGEDEAEMTDPINIRASSISGIIDCPKRGLSIQLGLVKQLPSTAPAIIGTACHAGTAAFDRARVDGNPIEPDDASEFIEKAIFQPEYDVDWGDMRKEEGYQRALAVNSRYCTDVSPRLEYQQVEMLLAPFVLNIDGVRIQLTGTLDRVYSSIMPMDDIGNLYDPVTAGMGILDVKTGASVCKQKTGKHKAQIGVYELLAEHTLGIKPNLPGLIAQLQTGGDTAVDVKEVNNAHAALIGNEEQKGLLYHIAAMLKTGDFYGNCSSMLCSVKFCPLYDKCVFR